MALTCRDVVEHLGGLFEGELADPDRAGIEGHLDACGPCTIDWRTYRQTIGTGRTAAQQGLGTDMPEALVQAILAVAAGQRQPARSRSTIFA